MKKIHTAACDTNVVKVYRDAAHDEFVCKVYSNGKHYEPADYFTNDKQDAIDTANTMAATFRPEAT